ncbi:recombinase family protein [Arthrobacter sp. NPDC093125]|uniref:recombinase family protein n=1 Tax=Arthrobacter sp. NPDC093125 TaxID=3363944 RepID=UPI0038203E91
MGAIPFPGQRDTTPSVTNAIGSVDAKVAIYARISSDREQSELGVERQVEACKNSRNAGFSVEGVYVDNNISAFTGKVRPQWRA